MTKRSMNNSCNKNIANLSLHDNKHDDILMNSSNGLILISKEQIIPSVVNDVLVIIWHEVLTAHYATICETVRIVNIHHYYENLVHVMTTISGECDVSIFMNELP